MRWDEPREPILRDVRWPTARRGMDRLTAWAWIGVAFLVGIVVGQDVFAVWWPR